MTSVLPYLITASNAYADTYSVPYPFCNVNAASVTTEPGENATGIVAMTLGGGDANAVACNGYTGYVGLAILGGSASGELVAIALGDGSSATGTSGPITIPPSINGSSNPGVAIAPIGYASGGLLNIGCTAPNDGMGTSVHWCPYLQGVNSSVNYDVSFVTGFPSCSVTNPGATYTDQFGNQWLCNDVYLSSDSTLYGWTPDLVSLVSPTVQFLLGLHPEGSELILEIWNLGGTQMCTVWRRYTFLGVTYRLVEDYTWAC